jgi:hypothetical protein
MVNQIHQVPCVLQKIIVHSQRVTDGEIIITKHGKVWKFQLKVGGYGLWDESLLKKAVNCESSIIKVAQEKSKKKSSVVLIISISF